MPAKKLAILAASLLLLSAWGCGSSRDSDGSAAGVGTSVQALGVGNCNICHAAIVNTWIAGAAHNNSNSTPDQTFFGHTPVTDCTVCHDPTGDSANLLPEFGLATRPVVGCEGCHGNGGAHRGIGPIPYPEPNAARCSTCHNTPDHPGTLGDQYFASKHAVSDHDGPPRCQRCHTHEGALLALQYNFTGDKAVMDANVNGQPELPEDQTGSITCATCHDPHDGGELRIDAAWNPPIPAPPGSGNDQFRLCTSCHTLYNAAGTLVTSGSGVFSTSAFYHDTAWYRIIATTHYDNPATGSVGTTDVETPIEGYVLRLGSADPCFDCHGHEAKTNTRPRNPADPSTIHTQWASSGHGGGLFKQKLAAAAALGDGVDPSTAPRSTATVDAIMTAAADDTSGIGWTHYNWDRTGRATCQRCHTATGAMNFLNNPTGYVAANNDFSHLASFNLTNGSPQNEMLYCWGCHSNAGEGDLRNPGALSFTYTNGAAVTFPDVAGSNVCMACHTGRENGDSIKLDPDADGIRGFINSHYLTAGGTVFTTSGYEYAGRNYNNVSFYEHDLVGSTAANGTGENGPCVGCHMSTGESHLFLPVAKDVAGNITAITSTVCAKCHTGSFALTPTVLMDEEHEYMASLEVLKAALASKGMFFANSFPYFHNDTNANQILDPAEIISSNGFTNWAGVYTFTFWKETMGAAFNANLLLHDPGGYAHNRFYAKGLIWDSIDFIDDGLLNNSVPATITALTATPDLLDTTVDTATASAAQTYLGSTRPGDANRLP